MRQELPAPSIWKHLCISTVHMLCLYRPTWSTWCGCVTNIYSWETWAEVLYVNIHMTLILRYVCPTHPVNKPFTPSTNKGGYIEITQSFCLSFCPYDFLTQLIIVIFHC